MSRVVPLPVVVPLFAAALSLAAARFRTLQRAISFAAVAGSLVAAVSLLVHVERTGEAAVARLGGWSPVIGISYVADRLAAVMLVISCATVLVVLLYAVGQGGTDERSPFYHPAYLAMLAGISAAFLAGDLFHLFVAFEVLLMSSYVLMSLNGDEGQIRSGTTYVVLNTVKSMLLLGAVGLVYAATGTLNMADLHDRLAALDPGLRTGLQLLLLVAFGLKAAVFPLFFWLPDSYPAAPSPVTAVFAGLLTKVGVYSIIRTQTLLFDGRHSALLLVIAGFTMIVGVLGALAQDDVKRILSFHIVSQIGYMVLGVALGGPAALAATVFFLLHQIPVKTSLFLVEGIVARAYGTSRLDRISGLARTSGPLGVLFLLPALSLAGLPPSSGFVGKLGIVVAGLDAEQWALVAAALVGSLLTLVSMTKIWTRVFWGEPPDVGAGRPALRLRRTPAMTAATTLLVACTVLIAVAAGPIYGFCERTAAELDDPARYPTAGATP